ncbi:MAG: GTPase HflX, partial [Acidimicrobiia bacterium]
PDPDRQITAVHSVLREIDAGDIPEVLVVNKTDIADPVAVKRLLALHPEAVATSAATGAGIDNLLATVATRLENTTDDVELVIPYDRGDVVALVHQIGRVAATEHTDDGTRITAQVPRTELHRFAGFVA